MDEIRAHLLIRHFCEIAPLGDDEARAIHGSMVVRRHARGHMLLQEGEVARECYFVLGGCVRQYALVAGEEVTSDFYTEGQWVLPLESFTTGVPSAMSLVCAEDVEVVVGNVDRENALFREHPRLEGIARRVMERVIVQQQAQIAGYLTDSPEQRYLKLATRRPDLLQRIPQYQVASYIGVKPESLSRIRKRLARQASAGQDG
jgi:CRP-like cAMP-binding protein